MWFVTPQELVNTKHYPLSNHFLIKFFDMVGLIFVSLSKKKWDFPIISQPMREMVMVRGVIYHIQALAPYGRYQSRNVGMADGDANDIHFV